MCLSVSVSLFVSLCLCFYLSVSLCLCLSSFSLSSPTSSLSLSVSGYVCLHLSVSLSLLTPLLPLCFSSFFSPFLSVSISLHLSVSLSLSLCPLSLLSPFLSLHISLSVSPSLSLSFLSSHPSAGTFRGEISGQECFCAGYAFHSGGAKSWGRRGWRGWVWRGMNASGSWLSLPKLKTKWVIHFIRPDKQGRDERQKPDWRHKLFNQSFHPFPCVNISWQPQRGDGSGTGCPHSQGQSLHLLPHGGWIPQSHSWEHEEGGWEDEGNPESQQCARSHSYEKSRNGIVNYVTHRFHCLWGSRTARFRRSVGGAPGRPCCRHSRASRGWAEEQRPSPAVAGTPQAAEETWIAHSCTQTSQEGHK